MRRAGFGAAGLNAVIRAWFCLHPIPARYFWVGPIPRQASLLQGNQWAQGSYSGSGPAGKNVFLCSSSFGSPALPLAWPGSHGHPRASGWGRAGGEGDTAAGSDLGHMPYPQALGLAPPKVQDRACGSDGAPIGSRLLQNEEGADARAENQRLLPQVREGLLKEGCEWGHADGFWRGRVGNAA